MAACGHGLSSGSKTAILMLTARTTSSCPAIGNRATACADLPASVQRGCLRRAGIKHDPFTGDGAHGLLRCATPRSACGSSSPRQGQHLQPRQERRNERRADRALLRHAICRLRGRWRGTCRALARTPSSRGATRWIALRFRRKTKDGNWQTYTVTHYDPPRLIKTAMERAKNTDSPTRGSAPLIIMGG